MANQSIKNAFERQWQHTVAYVDEAVSNNSSSGDGKYGQHCWHRRGYSYGLYSTSPSYTTPNSNLRIADGCLLPYIYITLFKNISITESTGAVTISGDLRHLHLSTDQTYDDIGDPIDLLVIDDSSNKIDSIEELADLLKSYDDGEGYIALGIARSPDDVNTSSTISITNYQLAKKSVQIFKLYNKSSSLIYLGSDNYTPMGGGLTRYYQYIELTGSGLRELKAPTITTTVDTYADVNDLVYSSQEDAYIEGDNGQGLIYRYLGVPSDYLPLNTQLKSGTYTGTGTTYCELIFDFKPDFIRILTAQSSTLTATECVTLMPALGFGLIDFDKDATSGSVVDLKSTVNSLTCDQTSNNAWRVKWQGGGNNSKSKYYYFAIGGIS